MALSLQEPPQRILELKNKETCDLGSQDPQNFWPAAQLQDLLASLEVSRGLRTSVHSTVEIFIRPPKMLALFGFMVNPLFQRPPDSVSSRS